MELIGDDELNFRYVFNGYLNTCNLTTNLGNTNVHLSIATLSETA